MAEYNPSLEESTSDLNLSIRKARLSSPSGFVPNFFHRASFETERRDITEHFPLTSATSSRQTSATKSFQVDKKPPRPRQSITDIIEQATQSVSAKYRPRPLSMSLGNNIKRETSPAGRLYNTMSVNSPLTAKSTKRAKVPKSRDGSPIVKSHTTEYVERRIMNRSVELKSIIYQENKEHLTKGKTAGKVVLGETNQRKEIERQLTSLENRLNRLKVEEENALKKVDNTNKEAEQALANKLRHKEDLVAKEIKNRKREESMQKRKNEINQEREETKMKASTAVLELLKSRYNQAQKMKKIAEEGKAREEERRRREEEKKKAVKEGIKTWIKSTKTIKVHNENLTRKNSGVNYSEKARMEKERAQDLLSKCKQLEEMEQEMLNRLGQTRALHVAKLNDLRNIQSVNVSYDN